MTDALYTTSLPTIHYHINQIHLQTGVDKDDLLSEANEITLKAWMTYDQDKSAWLTYLSHRLVALLNVGRREARRAEIEAMQIEVAQRELSEWDLLSLSPDARRLVEAILDGMVDGERGFATKHLVKSLFGWGRARTDAAWNELTIWYRSTF